MPATHKRQFFKALEIKNPFHEGQDRAFGDLLYDKIKEAQLWRRLTLIIIGLSVINLIFFIVSVNQQKTVPVLVNVMPSGESQYLGEVRQGSGIQVTDASIHFQIRSFITKLRTVSTDYQVVYDNIDDCFIMVTADYQNILRQKLFDDSPFVLVYRIRRTIDIESILHITGRSYNVNWTEYIIDTQNNQRTVRMRAVITIRLIQPTDATIRRNPLGIYIENFEMTEL